MSLAKRVFASVILSSALLLASCSGASGAAKGYSIRKSEISKSVSKSSITVKYKSATYVRVFDRDYYYEAIIETSFLGVSDEEEDCFFWEEDHSKTTLLTEEGKDYFCWKEGYSSTSTITEKEYNYVYSLISEGQASGEIGRL